MNTKKANISAMLFALLLLMPMITLAQQANILRVGNFSAPRSQNVAIPVYLDNTNDITAVEFTIQAPQGISFNNTECILSDRSVDHVVTAKTTALNSYRVMLYSPSNAFMRGQSGLLLSIPASISAALDDGQELPLTLSDVVICGTDGHNVLTATQNGNVTIQQSPDLQPTSLTVSTQSLAPGSSISAQWIVSNIGTEATQGGWKEEIYLTGTGNMRKLLASQYYEDVLNAGNHVERSASLTIPELPGMDGNVSLQVKIVPDSQTGESVAAQANNTAESSTLTLTKTLTIKPRFNSVTERDCSSLMITLTRSGYTDTDLTLNVAATDDSRISVPSTVTISKGQSSVLFYMEVTANKVLDDTSAVNITASGPGYNDASTQIAIEDDTLPSLILTSETDAITEGESLIFSIEAQRPAEQPIKVTMTCDLANRFNIPQIIIPAGQTTTEVIVESKDNNIPDILHFVTFTASANGYASDTHIIDLIDNDVPTLTLSLTPDAVSEAAGPLSVTALLKRTDNLDKRVAIRLSDNSDGEIFYTQQMIELAPGVEELTVALGPIDNTAVDGERTYDISAAVWIASCSCAAGSSTSGGVVSVPLTIYDNDGPALTLKSSADVVTEGGELELTVKHNTSSTSPVVVSLSSDHDEALEYPATVTITGGESSASFKVKAIGNDINGDSFTAVISADADGYSKANALFMVTDQTLPDGQIPQITASESEVHAGGSVAVTATVKNVGSYTLPEQTKVGFYLTSQTAAANASAYLQAPLQVGESIELTKTIKLPDVVGSHQIYAVVNDGQAVQELQYSNNRSAYVVVRTVSPYSFTVKTDKNIYQKDESITISGQANGNDVADKAIEIYVINDGYRHIINTTTDHKGKFNVSYRPYDGLLGHFTVGACYPGEGVRQELTSFDISAIKRTNSSAITCEPLLGETYHNSFTIMNYGPVAASRFNVVVESKPENCTVEISAPSEINANSTAEVEFTITPHATTNGTSWENITLNATTADGRELKTTLYYYCHTPKGNISTSVSSINATMNKDEARIYPITITNTGKGETGKITFALPSWISTATPRTISSLQPGESTEVLLQFNPSDDMAVNISKRGSLGINCENGNGVSIPYVITPVSEKTGTLLIDVCDNYTYFAEGAPHVENARVSLTNPATGKVVTSGNTNSDGTLTVELPEGYYSISVTADSHDSYSNNVYINPGREEKLLVNIFIQTISIDWTVEETEIEDEYSVKAVVKYETNVPAAVVKITLPEKIDGDNMTVGESTVINMNLTNIGLIAAENNTIILPENLTEWEFEALAYNEPFLLVPQQSVDVPVKITRKAVPANVKRREFVSDMSQNFSNCMAVAALEYEFWCGDSLKNNVSAENMALKMCAISATMGAVFDAFANMGWGGSTPASGPGTPSDGGGNNKVDEVEVDNPNPTQSFTICDPCDAARAEKLINLMVGQAGLVYSIANKSVDDAIKAYRDTQDTTKLRFVIRETGEDITNQIIEIGLDQIQEGLGSLYGLTIDIYEVVTACDELNSNDDNEGPDKTKAKKANDSAHNWNNIFDEVALQYIDQLLSMDEVLLMTFGSRIWYSDLDTEKLNFLKYAQNLPEGYRPTEEELLAIKPESVSIKQMYDYIDHINGIGDTFPSMEELTQQIAIYDEANTIAEEKGYKDMMSYFDEILKDYSQHFKEMQSGESVCASISLQLSQKVTMTRQAFRGILTVFNGHGSIPMTNVKLTLDIRDNNGRQVTSQQMQINPESLTGFQGDLELESQWALDAGETGVATILFIPTKYAAPTEPCNYSFGGTLTYIDPFTGLEITRNLYPVSLTVKPSPNLDLTYFMQRDVLGDDPLTEEIEPSEEAEFSLLIHNTGYGDATNVRIVTEQPQIIENEKLLQVDFELISSQLNGADKNLALGGNVSTEFGNIPAHSTAYAQWWLKCSLLGHFTDYNIEATHVTSYGNPDLSLLNEVTIHELIRSVEIPTDSVKLTGFITNDIVDKDDAPDMIYLTNGDIQPVYVASDIRIKPISDLEYELTITPVASGWNYGNLYDPTYGNAKLTDVIRQSDHQSISLRNFWQTDRTLRDGKEPLVENRLHFADEFLSTEPTTYTLKFELLPKVSLAITDISGLPKEETIATEPIEQITISFNTSINPASFTVEDLSLNIEGQKIDNLCMLSIKPVQDSDNRDFTLNFGSLTLPDGHYVLTVNTLEIFDDMGFTGSDSYTAAWSQRSTYPVVDINIPLKRGWNWISTPIADESMLSREIFFSSIDNTIEQIVGSDGEVDKLSNATYKVKASDNAVINITASTHRPENFTVTLQPGWNWIPYIPLYSADINDALSLLKAAKNDVVRTHTAFAIYDGSQWIGTLETMRPGNGYLYLSSDAKSFTYPEKPSASTVKAAAYAETYWEADHTLFANNMSAIAKLVDKSSTPLNNNSDFIIGAFDENGICRGISAPVRDVQFLTIHGNEGEKITLRNLSSTGVDYNIITPLIFTDDHVGTIDSPLLLSVDENPNVSQLSELYSDSNSKFVIMPAPVRDYLTIGEIGECDIAEFKVMTITGEILLSVGDYNGCVNVSKLRSGIYIGVIITDEGSAVYRKFLKL